MLIVEFSLDPMGFGDSMREPVARAVDIIDRSGLKYRVGPMGTCIEGEWDDVMDVIRDCVEEVESNADRILFTIRGDLHIGNESRLDKQVKEVEETLNRPVDH